MNATITISKQDVDLTQVQAVVALAKARGWTVEWTVHGVE